MKNVSLICAAMFLFQAGFGQVKMDTVLHMPVGPGITHTRLIAPSVPWVINVLSIDLTSPYLTLETVKARDRLRAFEIPSSMSARKSAPGHTVIGAVNGDFYDTGTGIPINIQVCDGEVLRTPINLSTLGFDGSNRPMLARTALSITVNKGSDTIRVANVNATRGTDQLILYNRYFGASTATNQWGTEAMVTPLGEWLANAPVLCVVDSLVAGRGNMALLPGNAVLSGHGVARAFLDSALRPGDTIAVYQGIANALPSLKELIGGYPKIVANGANYVDQGYAEEGGPDHTYDRHPRTGAGFSADSARLYLVTVDGRQVASAGMTLKELADFMISFGVHTGINFDGGGSTAMVVRGMVANSPSDGGGERAVANGLIVASSAPPSTDTLAQVVLNPRSLRLYLGETTTYTLGGTDRFGNPVPLTAHPVTYAVRSSLGTIDTAGRFVAGSNPDSGFIVAAYGSWMDSAYVVVKGLGRITLSPRNAVADTIHPLTIRFRAFDTDGIEKALAPSQFIWDSRNPGVGTVDANGVVHGIAPGSTVVSARWLTVADSVTVTVEVRTGVAVLDSIEQTSSWTFGGVNVDIPGSSAAVDTTSVSLGSGSLKVSYRFTYDPSKLYYVRLDGDIPVYGVPDSLYLDVKTDSTGHRLYYWAEDENGEQFKFASGRYVAVTGSFDRVPVACVNPVPVAVGSLFNFPMRLKRIEFQLGSRRVAGAVYAGTITVDNLRARYPGVVTSVSERVPLPQGIRLFQNYPNPFNPSTVIGYTVGELGRGRGGDGGRGSVLVRLSVYDLLGREVAVLVNEHQTPGSYTVRFYAGGGSRSGGDGAGLASGVYFYRLQAGGGIETRRMILLR